MSISRLMQTASGKRGFDPNTPIGTAIEGGFFAGIITQGGDDYAIIVSPKASGENTNVQFKTSQTASPIETQTLNNGPAATAAMVAAGSHPAAAFCAGLTIAGFSDWYLPARDELEICYRNLKPGTSANNISDRAKSAINYPEGDDLLADTMGVNRNSSPTGSAYTTVNPAQTTVTAFNGGGAEVFDAQNHYSSSEFSNGFAWRQNFNNGFTGTNEKNGSMYARAVRRVAI